MQCETDVTPQLMTTMDCFCFSIRSDKPTVNDALSTRLLTEGVGNQLVNVVEHLAVAKSRMNIGITFARWKQTQLKINNNVVPHLLIV